MPKRKQRAPSPKFDLLDDGFDDDLSSNDDKPGTPVQRNAANARERARMRVLSKAFFNLKRNIPWVPVDTKLSKLDTLRLAKNYITYLAATLDGQSVEDFSSNLPQPPKTAWPFIFQQVPQAPHDGSKSKPLQPGAVMPPLVTTVTASSSDPKWSIGTATGPAVPPVPGIKSLHIAPSPQGTAAGGLGAAFADDCMAASAGSADYSGYGAESPHVHANHAHHTNLNHVNEHQQHPAGHHQHPISHHQLLQHQHHQHHPHHHQHHQQQQQQQHHHHQQQQLGGIGATVPYS